MRGIGEPSDSGDSIRIGQTGLLKSQLFESGFGLGTIDNHYPADGAEHLACPGGYNFLILMGCGRPGSRCEKYPDGQTLAVAGSKPGTISLSLGVTDISATRTVPQAHISNSNTVIEQVLMILPPLFRKLIARKIATIINTSFYVPYNRPFQTIISGR